MFSSWPLAAFVEGVKSVSGQRRGLLQALGQHLAADGAIRLVLLPAGAGEVAAHDALHRQRLRLSHDHGAAGERLREGRERGREAARIERDEVIRDRRKALEPKGGERVQDGAFARDGVGQDAVEGRNAIGRDEQEVLAEIEDFADLAAGEFADSGEFQARARASAQRRLNRARLAKPLPKSLERAGEPLHGQADDIREGALDLADHLAAVILRGVGAGFIQRTDALQVGLALGGACAGGNARG